LIITFCSDLLQVWIIRTKFLPRVTYGKDNQLISVDPVDYAKIALDSLSQIDPLRFRYVAAALRVSFQAPYRREECLDYVSGCPGAILSDVLPDLGHSLKVEWRPDEPHRRRRARTSSLAVS
jgi:hypothetical protein